VEAVDFSTSRITLSKPFSKLHELHPSDLADIIEDLGKTTRTDVFASLDDEKAADVLEELEVSAQIDILERLPLDKAADVLELMPADEVADILDELDKDRAELLLNEMEKEASEEVRELLEYEDNEVGSIMTTDFLILKEEMTIEDSLSEIRSQKPEADMIYSLYVTDKKDRLISSVSLRDLVVSEPSIRIRSIMKRNPVKVFDDDKIDSLAEIISKYNLLAIPVTDREHKLQGMVVIDDIVEDLLDKRKTK
jgi:Mg/Co/Ni transporter MgtE